MLAIGGGEGMGVAEIAVGAHVEIVMGLMVEHQLGPSFLQAEVNNGIKHDTYRKHTGHGSNANVERVESQESRVERRSRLGGRDEGGESRVK